MKKVLHIKAIVCNALRREFYLCAARSPNVVDVVVLPQGLHDTPEILRESVRREIARSPELEGFRKDCPVPVDADRPYDAIVLGYALCSNATAGINAGECPLVIPRAHDCITLLLGSSKKYLEHFNDSPGSYWYSSGWIETCMMHGKEEQCEKLRLLSDKYGEDNARYLVEAEQAWLASYNKAVYIDWGFPNSDAEKKRVKACAEYMNWEYESLRGDSGMIQGLLNGDWNDEDFLVVQPGEQIVAAPGSGCILKAGKA